MPRPEDATMNSNFEKFWESAHRMVDSFFA